MNRIILISMMAAAVTLFALAQSTNIPPDIDKSGRTITPRPQPHLIYSPADLAHNAVTLPASGTTSVSRRAGTGRSRRWGTSSRPLEVRRDRPALDAIVTR